ncbi:MAG: NAD(P)-dependent oxidoreductase [bacterium]|nr:NAD(P)-dependent oxidoreductase [bacterium]
MKRILITGTSGRLGAALARHFGPHCDIVQLDLTAPSDKEQAELGRVVVGSTTDPVVVTDAMEGVDAVIHSAAIPGNIKACHRLIETNVMGTFNVLQAASENSSVERFLFISSLCWHGIFVPPADKHMPEYLPIDEDHPTHNSDMYCCSKVQGEYWCRVYVQNTGKPVVSIRPTRIIRPDEEPTFAAHEPAADPRFYDYVGTGDLVRAIDSALDYHPPNGFDAFLCNADDQYTTMPTLELVDRFCPGVRVDREKLQGADGFGALIDTAHARETLGWRPEYRCKRS